MTLTETQQRALEKAAQLEKEGAPDWTPYEIGAGMQTIRALARLRQVKRSTSGAVLGAIFSPATELRYCLVGKQRRNAQ